MDDMSNESTRDDSRCNAEKKANIELIEIPYERISHSPASQLLERELASRLTNLPCPVTALKA